MRIPIKILAQAVLLLGCAAFAHAQTQTQSSAPATSGAAHRSSTAHSARAPITVPSGTPINVVLNEEVSSKTAKVGDKISASVADNVVVGGKTVIPKGAPATIHVTNAVPSGRLSTPAELDFKLHSVNVKGRTYLVSTDTASSKKNSHKKRNILAIGGGTAAGALIGGIAGGGKGAAIGGAAGAGVGTAGAAATGKKDISYPAETKMVFTLQRSLIIR